MQNLGRRAYDGGKHGHEIKRGRQISGDGEDRRQIACRKSARGIRFVHSGAV
jgi:hypothetical protein